MKKSLIFLLLAACTASYAQKQDTALQRAREKIYRATPTRINDLVHTKLEASFDIPKARMYGKAWITLHPHFYPTDSLTLDAKKMEIDEVAILKGKSNVPLKFTYDSAMLRITLDRTYYSKENYTIFIRYITRSKTGSSFKGLHFVNPYGKDPKKPVQVWTQGETETNSYWVPIIDKPNQKTTDEISMTVPSRYVTLSNGVLASSKKNSDGTRTDKWKMDLPHAPYLMMMGIGDFAIIRDKYKGKEVNYYVEREYAPVARRIFGLTPEMITFFSKITGVEYPWQKYSQIVMHEFGGAMENTTATIHGESAQQDARELIDGNRWETIIAHELFHMWFGDYVTTESWSNLALNESFADYSQTLWEEYKYGRDEGDAENFDGMQTYLMSRSEKKDLVRFYYGNDGDMFDAVSYQKGGRILHMLHNYVGDSAFYASMKLYLNTNRFKAAEVHQLRLAFEEVTGQDLNWFFNEWFFGSGHPKLDINYSYNDSSKTERIIVNQKQPDKVFRFPTAIDVYNGDKKTRTMVWITDRTETIDLPVQSRPDLVNFDGDKVLLCEKTENKTLENYIFQYIHAGTYLDRREAIDFIGKKQSDPVALEFMETALKDRYYGLREFTLQRLNLRTDSVRERLEHILLGMASDDPKAEVRGVALNALGGSKKAGYKDLYLKALNDSSYTVSGYALTAIAGIDSTLALEKAAALDDGNVKGQLKSSVYSVLFKYSDESKYTGLAGRFREMTLNDKFMTLQSFTAFLKRLKNPEYFRNGVDLIVQLRDTIPEEYRGQVAPYLNGMILNGLAMSKKNNPELSDYVRSKMPGYKSAVKTAFSVPPEQLQKYVGDYELNGQPLQILLSDGKTLVMKFQGQQDMELEPVSAGKFNIKYMDGYTIQFNGTESTGITDFDYTAPGGSYKATRKR